MNEKLNEQYAGFDATLVYNCIHMAFVNVNLALQFAKEENDKEFYEALKKQHEELWGLLAKAEQEERRWWD